MSESESVYISKEFRSLHFVATFLRNKVSTLVEKKVRRQLATACRVASHLR